MQAIQENNASQFLQTKRMTIPYASQYEIDSYGFVYRNDKKLKLRRQGPNWFAYIYDDKGKAHSFDSEKLARTLFDGNEEVLTRDLIEESYKVRTVPEFPRYVATPYGAVYCIDPPKRGRNAGQCYLVSENLSRGKPYVTLYKSDGTSRRKQVAWVVKSAWED
tara:strand:+ start:753 stop:1241 length:489 start_codon:yes stop_codon:yes gene_type:complete